MITDINIIMMAHKYQPSSKDQAHHTDTTLTPHYILKCSVVWDCGCGVVRRHRGLCSYRVRGVDGSRATHLTVESYTVVMLLTFILIIISITSPLTLPFQAYNLPFLQILLTVAFPFFFRTDSTDSPYVDRYF